MSDVELPELERPRGTVYRGEVEGKLNRCFSKKGEVVKKYDPEVYVSDPGNLMEFPLLPRRELSNSSPGSRFQWGYSGHGPYMLAVSLVADAYGDDEAALEYQTPVEELLKGFDQHDDWELEIEDLDEYIRVFG